MCPEELVKFSRSLFGILIRKLAQAVRLERITFAHWQILVMRTVLPVDAKAQRDARTWPAET